MSTLLTIDSWLIVTLLLVGMLFSIWLGVKAGRRFMNLGNPEHGKKKSSSDISSLTGLLFFLLAFTFSMSGARYESRREIVVDEANTIGTALLRSDLYADEERAAFRADFSQYLEARIDYFEAGTDIKRVFTADSLSQEIGTRLWNRATRLAKDPLNLAATQHMIPALNEMMDIATTRTAREKAKVPETIVWMLFVLALVASFYIGYNSVRKGPLDWVVAGGFCVLVSLVVYITLDLDRQRRGFINLNEANEVIIDLRKNFR